MIGGELDQLDPVTQGLLVYTMAALLAGVITKRWPLALAAAAVGWVPWLLIHHPRVGSAAAAFTAWLVVRRYGWRHVLGAALGVVTFSTVLLGRTQQGWDFGLAIADAVRATFWLALLAGILLWLWRLAKGRVDYLTGYGLAQETRRLQQTAEHRKIMGYGRRGTAWLGRKSREVLTRPPGRVVEGAPPRELPARAAEIPAAHPVGPAGATIAEPLFTPQPWWRWR